MKQAHHPIFSEKNAAIYPITNYKGTMVCYPHTPSLADRCMHLKKGFAYTIKEPETSIENNEVSRDIIPYIFLKETQRQILRLNNPPPF